MKSDTSAQEKKSCCDADDSTGLAYGISIGVGVGVALGTALDNIDNATSLL